MLEDMSIGKEQEETDVDVALRARFARNVRKIRIQRNMSQDDLAESSGLHRNFVSEVERERRNVTLTTIGRLARGLGVEEMELLRPLTEGVQDLPRELPKGAKKKGTSEADGNSGSP